jgi:hypothetical protein
VQRKAKEEGATTMRARSNRFTRLGYIGIAVLVAVAGAWGLEQGQPVRGVSAPLGVAPISRAPVAAASAVELLEPVRRIGRARPSHVATSRSAAGRATGPGTDTLWSDERLNPGESIVSGGTELVYQGDNHLVLYQNGNPVWASWRSLNAPTEAFVMQGNCEAIVYHQAQNIMTGEWSTVAGWRSRTENQGGGCFARVTDGDWFICNGQTRIWSARGGGSCDEGATCRVTGYANQQQTTENTYSVQYPFQYCSQLTGELPPECSFYCAYVGGNQGRFDVKALRGTRTIRKGQPVDSCGNTNPFIFVIGDDSQPSGTHCWTLTGSSCVDNHWRNPVGPRC